MTSSYNNTLYSMEQTPKRVADLSEKIQAQLILDLLAEANALALDVNLNDISFSTLTSNSTRESSSTKPLNPVTFSYVTPENALLLNSNNGFIRSVSSTRAAQNRQPSTGGTKVYDFLYDVKFRT